MPLISVVSGKWTMLLARDSPAEILIVNVMQLGDTESLPGVYALHAALGLLIE